MLRAERDERRMRHIKHTVFEHKASHLIKVSLP